MDKLIFKKRIRLKNFSYKGFFRYFITICCQPGLMLTNEIIEKLIQELKLISEKYDFDIWAYCFMPDHVHLLIGG